MRIAPALVTAVLAGVLVGCSGEQAPSTLPPVSVAPSPTAAAALAVPSEAVAETPQGAAAFARFYMDPLTRAFDTADASAVRAVSAPDCESCNNYIRAIEEPITPGERVVGGAFQVTLAESAGGQTGDEVLVDLRYSIAEIRVLAPDGEVLRTTAPEPSVDAVMVLNRRGDGWVVRRLVSGQ